MTGFMGGAFPPSFPEELLPLVKEFRRMVKRHFGKPRSVVEPVHVGETLLMWWSHQGEIGIGDGSKKQFEPILVTINDRADVHAVSEWGSVEEIQEMMRILKTHLVLDTLADL